MLLLLLLLMVMMLELLLMLLNKSSDVGILIGENTYDTGGNFVVGDGFIVFAYDISTKFLLGFVRMKQTPEWG